MLALMHGNNGIGLAATQVGHSRRIFVMCISGRTRLCFNPEITESGTVFADYDEGCLSFLGDQCTITRPDWVRVRYQDPSGAVTEDTLVALEARCFQHELDHLDGIPVDVVKQGTRSVTEGPGRNDPCPCGSGKKFKKCCMFRA
jgi:peptide deformylase